MTLLPRLALTLLALAAAVPMAWALLAAAWQVLDAAAWRALANEPQAWRAAGLSLWTGLAATALAWLTVGVLLSRAFIQRHLTRWLRLMPAMLATPHAAMAIGLVFWLSPSGWLLRLVSPWLTGWNDPPPWPTTQDPWGLGLIAALWFKETPFLLWVAATQLQRDDVRRQFQAEHTLAQTLGHAPAPAFAQVVWPQLATRLYWPLLAVLAYGLTVVDMALIIGPATPPTLAVLAWQWLGDADLATQKQGVAAAAMLSLGVGLLAVLLRWPALFARVGVKPVGWCISRLNLRAWPLLLTGYACVWWALAVGSVAGVWPFPDVWPQLWTASAWTQVWASGDTLLTTLSLGLSACTAALVWCVLWLEWAPRRWQVALGPWLQVSLVVPAVMWVVGLYSVALTLRLEGEWLGVWAAHTLMALPYVLLALAPAYSAVDPRLAQVAASLGHGRWRFVRLVKWPLLKRSLASSWAVGFAVSVAQYLPTLYVGAGRWSTVTTEAVTLASDAQRSLTGAYAVLQMVLPLAVFGLAAWLGRPRRFQ